MEKTKKNGILKTAACIFGGTMLMTCILGGTLAKYVSSGTAAETKADVAKWDIQVAGEKLEDELQLNLTDMTKIESTGAMANTEAYTTKPAPGSWGYKEIEVKNGSDVDAKISISGVAGSNTSSGIHVAVMTDTPDASNITNAGVTEKSATVAAGTSTKLYVAYSWDWDTDDSNDTILGTTEGGGKINFGAITVKAEQDKYNP